MMWKPLRSVINTRVRRPFFSQDFFLVSDLSLRPSVSNTHATPDSPVAGPSSVQLGEASPLRIEEVWRDVSDGDTVDDDDDELVRRPKRQTCAEA